MRYMLLVYTAENASEKMSAEDAKRITAGHWSVMDEMRKLGILEGAEPLYPTRTATTLRHDNGKVITTDGPFAETKEQLAGYYIVDCKDLDEAIHWASKLPTECGGGTGCIEIRPILGLSRRPEEQPAEAAAVNG